MQLSAGLPLRSLSGCKPCPTRLPYRSRVTRHLRPSLVPSTIGSPSGAVSITCHTRPRCTVMRWVVWRVRWDVRLRTALVCMADARASTCVSSSSVSRLSETANLIWFIAFLTFTFLPILH